MDKEDVGSQTSFFGAGQLRPGAVQVTVKDTIQRQELTKLIETIADLHGCRGCGLGGLDVVIRPEDPRIKDAFRDLENVVDVAVLR